MTLFLKKYFLYFAIFGVFLLITLSYSGYILFFKNLSEQGKTEQETNFATREESGGDETILAHLPDFVDENIYPGAGTTHETESGVPMTQAEKMPTQSASPGGLAKEEPEIVLPISLINERARSALVNIICTTGAGGILEPISGTGVIIDESGVILTNAHIAQYFLLTDYPKEGAVECVIRMGSPAEPRFRAKPLFIPRLWILRNAHQITSSNPMGTGEYDYALLYITEGVGTVSRPNTFSALPLNTEGDIAPEKEVLLAGYPAGFLGGITIQRSLYSASAVGTVGELFTFGDGTVDLFSVGGSVIAQRGSSGGPAVGRDGRLVGLLTTATNAEQTGARDMRAIAIPYINHDFEREMGISLSALLKRDVRIEAEKFMITHAPGLRALLITELKK